MTWREDEYIRMLADAREDFAWVMERCGGRTPEQAVADALAAYPFEPSDVPHRGLVFHDDAWHWAMVAIHGYLYWREHPELERPSAEYLERRG
ncbi:hypothetical protein OG874_03455 [Nocardia sp. NBC_00565]|uniref:hypothetical protein n=1 Tax=Nocardia sp. NBC_00565 TaxID=2975993 RepID=UPI002E80EB8D|nr:hypothetical protein [Nocardia sp. NBC_00565]WUC04275.1 hypothetical protein OG874_03455 [Nocardia sp. NBC_00565]